MPSLDGLRAVSVLLVLLCHVAETVNSPVPGGAYWYTRQAAVGVDVFFVISGFLITSLLLRERDETGTISLRRFYARRAWRILPAFVAYLGFLAVLDLLGATSVPSRGWIAAATYTVNFTPGLPHPLWHIWSLSVEEHFYLLWPLALLLLGVGRAGRLAAVVLFAEPLVRWVTHRYAGGVVDIDFATFTRLDAIAVGCLLAMGARFRGPGAALRALDAKPACWFWGGVAVLALSVCVLGHSGKYTIAARGAVNAVAIGVVVWTAIRCPATPFGRALNWPPFAWLGRISYSLYIWQQVFLDHTNGTMWMCRYPQNLALSLVTAVASYYLIERPFLRLRDRRGRTPYGAVAGAARPQRRAVAA